MGAEDTPMNTPKAVEAKNAPSDLAKAFTILINMAEQKDSKMIMLSLRLKQ